MTGLAPPWNCGTLMNRGFGAQFAPHCATYAGVQCSCSNWTSSGPPLFQVDAQHAASFPFRGGTPRDAAILRTKEADIFFAVAVLKGGHPLGVTQVAHGFRWISHVAKPFHHRHLTSTPYQRHFSHCAPNDRSGQLALLLLYDRQL